jgi:D-lactate dehydrogenase
MKVAVFSAMPYDIRFLNERNAAHGHELRFFDARLDADTALLAAGGTRHVAMRCAGFNNVDLKAAAELGILVARVPAYSPRAVAEHTVAMMLTLNRQTSGASAHPNPTSTSADRRGTAAAVPAGAGGSPGERD